MDAKAMVITLRSLKLYGMAQAAEELNAQGSPAYQQSQPILGALIKAETGGSVSGRL
jgi:hypothetical protein